MIKFPSVTRLPQERVIYRPYKRGNADFFDNLALTNQEKQELRNQIADITITHAIDESLTNIPKGQTVKQILVLRVKLIGELLDTSLLDKLDIRLQLYTIFHIVNQHEKEEIYINFKEKLTREQDGKHFKVLRHFASQDDLEIKLEGNDLDQVYEHLVKDVAKEDLQVQQATVKESIQISDDIAKLEKRAQQLKKKMYSEKSMKKQMELKKQYRALLQEIDGLKIGRSYD